MKIKFSLLAVIASIASFTSARADEVLVPKNIVVIEQCKQIVGAFVTDNKGGVEPVPGPDALKAVAKIVGPDHVFVVEAVCGTPT